MATVAGLFENRTQAESAIRELQSRGIDKSNIGIAMRDRDEMRDVADTTGVEPGAATAGGAVAGGVIGGGLGLLLSAIGAVTVPVIGPIVAAGPLIAGLTGAGLGAATGGLIGALTEAGVPEEEARVYQTGVERGGVLLTVNAPQGQESAIRSILNSHGSVDPNTARGYFNDPDYRMGRTTTTTGGGFDNRTNRTGDFTTGDRADARGVRDTSPGSEALAGGASAVVGGLAGAAIAGPAGAVAGAAIGGAAGAGAAHTAEDDIGSNAGAMTGGASGAVVGGAIGAVGGPVGAAIGAGIGGAVGAAGGDEASEQVAGEKRRNRGVPADETDPANPTNYETNDPNYRPTTDDPNYRSTDRTL
jgi:hypothetical protein